MNIIDNTYFVKGDLLIEGLSGTGAMSQAMEAEVDRYILEYGTEYLYALLGAETAKDFIEYADKVIAQEEVTDNPAYDALLEALRNRHGVEKRSPLANYVFYWYVREHQLRATGIGVTYANSDNQVVTPVTLLTRVWNQMADMSLELIQEVIEPEGITFSCRRDLLDHINTLGV